MTRAAKSSTARILLVDDHPMMRFGMSQLIDGKQGLSVCAQAGTASEALQAVEKSKPDLVVTDLTMPDKGGLELIKDLAALHPNLPVLVISMHDELLYAERALRAGARGYLMKEAGGEKMIEAIRRVLSGQVYVSDRMSAQILNSFAGRKTSTIPQSVESLSDREFEVFELIGQGKSTQEIATQLILSHKTVAVHRAHIREKLNIKSGPELTRFAVRWVETRDSGT